MSADPSATPRERLSGLMRVAFAGLIWGTIPLLLRWADGASIVKVFFRVSCAGLVVGGSMLLSGRWREFRSMERRKLASIAVQGLILTLNWVLFLGAFDLTTVATAELLGYTGPIIIAGLAPFVTKERFDKRIIGPLLLAVAGTAIILAPQGIAVTGGRSTLGALLAFLSAFTYAALMLRSKKLLRGVSSSALMTVEYGVAAIVLAPFVLVAYAQGQGPSTPDAYAALITLGVVQTAFAGFLFLGGLRHIRTDSAAILTYIEPASAVVFAALFLPNEPLTWPTAIGGTLVVAGGVAVARLDSRAGIGTVPIEAVGCDECPEPPLR